MPWSRLTLRGLLGDELFSLQRTLSHIHGACLPIATLSIFSWHVWATYISWFHQNTPSKARIRYANDTESTNPNSLHIPLGRKRFHSDTFFLTIFVLHSRLPREHFSDHYHHIIFKSAVNCYLSQIPSYDILTPSIQAFTTTSLSNALPRAVLSLCIGRIILKYAFFFSV